jgi:hypothetical protein
MRQFGISLLAATGLWLVATAADGQEKKLKDEDIAKLLVGKWVQEKAEKGFSMKVQLIVKKDGTFAGDLKFELGEKKMSFMMTGTWKVMDGTFETKITTSDNPRVKVGHTDKDKVLEINDKVFRTRSGNAKDKDEPDTVWQRGKD